MRADCASFPSPSVTWARIPQFFDVDFVVKPCVGAGSLHVERYRPEETARARAHIAALHAEGRDALIQPYINSVDTLGERALVFVDGSYSHAMTKGAMLQRSSKRARLSL